MLDKKRKAVTLESVRPAKKQQTTDPVQVNHHAGPDIAKPVVATTAGIVLPSKLKFSTFSKANLSGPKDLLLHSTDHPTIDYTAVESRTANSHEKYMKHYIAVFDPATGSLNVTEAKKMIVRPEVRQFQTEAKDQSDTEPKVKPSARAALTEAFGTKKSKKTVQALAENRLLARGGDGDDPLSQAILTTLAGEDDDELDRDNLIRSNKPLPRANLEAQKVEDAYPLSTLVIPSPHEETLSSLSFAFWKSCIAASRAIKSASRFVANRVEYLIAAHLRTPENISIIRQCQILRYVELLLQFHSHIMSLHHKQSIPDPNRWPEKILKSFSSVSKQAKLLQSLIFHFFPERRQSHYALTLLRSTILTLTLHVPAPSLRSIEGMLATEPTDISLDLAMERTEANRLFRELGCKLAPPSEKELATWGLSKMSKKTDTDGKEISLPKPKFAKLSLPSSFRN